jgi:(S)-citramalyl-CoA lyase
MPAPFSLGRSLLFFPADHPELLAKAVASGADAVCADLEDAVAPDAKEAARELALGRILAGDRRGAELVLRINDPKSEAGRRDLDALCTADSPPDALLLPKVASADEVAWVAGVLAPWHPELRVIPLIETARGLAAAEAIAQASDRVGGLMFGALDLAVELGCAVEWDALLYGRSRVVHAAALAGVGALDVPFMDVSDHEGLARQARAVRGLGFRAKAAIHPSQVPIIQDAFTPSAEELARAAEVIAADEASGGAPVLREGRVIDRPVVEAARRTLALAASMRARPAPS